MLVLTVDSNAVVLGCCVGSSSSYLDNLALLRVARSILLAFFLAFIKTMMIDVNTIMDIVKPIANILADAVAPTHPELTIIDVPANYRTSNLVSQYFSHIRVYL